MSSRPSSGFLRRSASRRLTAEVATLRRHGREVIRFEPGPDVRAVMGPNPMDPDRVPAVVDAARSEAEARLASGLSERILQGRLLAA